MRIKVEKKELPEKNTKQIMKKVRQRIRELMAEKKITQKALANQLGVQPPFVSQMLSGVRNISLETAIGISQILHISMDELVGFNEIQSPNSIERKDREDFNLISDGPCGKHRFSSYTRQVNNSTKFQSSTVVTPSSLPVSSNGFSYQIIDSYITELLQSIKEIQEAETELTKAENEYSDIKKEFFICDNKTKGLLNEYYSLIVQNDILNCTEDDCHENTDEIDKRTKEIGKEIEGIAPSIAYYELCKKRLDRKKRYEYYKEKLNEVKLRRVAILLQLYQTLDSSKTRG